MNESIFQKEGEAWRWNEGKGTERGKDQIGTISEFDTRSSIKWFVGYEKENCFDLIESYCYHDYFTIVENQTIVARLICYDVELHIFFFREAAKEVIFFNDSSIKGGGVKVVPLRKNNFRFDDDVLTAIKLEGG